ncbi:hypothetical protein RSOL_560180, partial [Rhizoctonia solani AG-3 Rhs1AP]
MLHNPITPAMANPHTTLPCTGRVPLSGPAARSKVAPVQQWESSRNDQLVPRQAGRDIYLFDSDYFSYLVDSPEHIPSPEMHNMDYFPHRVFVISRNCTGCLLSATVPVWRVELVLTRAVPVTQLYRAGQLCKSFESAHFPGMYPIHTSSTIKPHVLRSITPTLYPLRVLAPVQEQAFLGQPMTHGQSALGEATSGARSHEGEDDDTRIDIGSPEEDMDHGGLGVGGGPGIRLPPIHTLPPMAPIYTGPTTIPQDILLYGPAGVTPAPAKLLRNNVHDKLPLVPAFAPLATPLLWSTTKPS